MKTLTIDKEFQELIPPLNYEEEELLIASIKEEGCHTPLVVWGDILVDGHNRYDACIENGIEFETRSMEFADRDDAKIWIIKNQFGRRNLSTPSRCDLALKMKGLFEAKAKERKRANGGDKVSEKAKAEYQKKETPVIPSLPAPAPRKDGYLYTSVVEYKLEHYNPPEPQTVITDQPVHTMKELGKIADVSHDTMHKYKVIVEQGTPQQVKLVKDEEESINKVYNQIRDSQMTGKQIADKEERAEMIRLAKARERRIAAEAQLAQNQRTGFAKTVVNAVISDLNRISVDDPERDKELDRLVAWIHAAREATK